MRKKFVEVTSKLFEFDENIILLLGDIGVYSFEKLSSKFPTRVLNTGIMEQTMIGFAAGLSKRGMIPIVHSINPFLIERALEQIKIDFAYQGLAGNIISVGASYDYVGLGPTHHGPADIPTLFNVPNINLYVPGSRDEFEKQLENNYNNRKLNYFRISEFPNNETLRNEEYILRNPKSKKYIIAAGPTMNNVRAAAIETEYNIIYVNEIKKMSIDLINDFKNAQEIVTVEPYYPGTLLNILVSQGISCSFKQIGVRKEFHNFYGTYDDHLEFDGLDAKRIRKLLLNE